MAERFERERYRSLAEEGQRPTALIIACSDSRSAPETIFGAGPGELFVVRNVANMVPPYEPDSRLHATSAAIEFAVLGLNVTEIIVLGHGRCGGVKAALDPDHKPLSPGDFIGNWMTLVASAATRIKHNDAMTLGERQTALERISIRNSLANLRSFPEIVRREQEGLLRLHGAWFDISTGELWLMDPDSGDFSRPEIGEARVLVAD